MHTPLSLPTRLVALLAALVCALLLPANLADAAALTSLLEPHERACYYAWVDKAGEKVGFYFAVQSGGAFDIDYVVHDPLDKVIIEGKKERQLDIIFTGNEVGEYSFCFENQMSTFAEKLVSIPRPQRPDRPASPASDRLASPHLSHQIDFDITVESEPRLDLPISAAALLSEHSAPLETSISKMQEKLTNIARTQRYFRVRENRNFGTVKSTRSKILWYSITESLVMVGISVGQVYFVRALFEKGSTKRYRV